MGDIVRVVRKGRFIGWYVRYKDTDGRRRMRASHQPTLQLARRYLLEIEGRVARGLIGIPEPTPPPPTVEALVERFLVEYRRPKIKDLARYRAHARTALRRVLMILGSRGSGTLGAADVQRLREGLAQRFAANSVRISLTFAATVFSWAVRAAIVPDNPFRAVELPARQDLVEYLSQHESRALLMLAAEQAASGGPTERMRHACIHLALHTGLRKGELYGLRWLDVDLEALRLTVARSFRVAPKGGKPRHLRLPSACARILEPWRAECPRTPEGLVFPVMDRRHTKPRMGESRTMLELPRLLREAGCRPLRRAWHALRHTFASHFVMSGGNILALQKILGHHDIKETMIYAHLAPDFLGDEMERVRY
jgi:site-specific recombinase XerD